jgi:hypothetical protein
MAIKTKRPPQTSLQLPPEGRAALARLKKIHGVNKVVAVTRGVIMLENNYNQAEGIK